ncbi:hypothetical protein KUCAC02_000268, partial [Chaenocephalus aceratus]
YETQYRSSQQGREDTVSHYPPHTTTLPLHRLPRQHLSWSTVGGASFSNEVTKTSARRVATHKSRPINECTWYSGIKDQ